MGYWKTVATGNSDNLPDVVFAGDRGYRVTLTLSRAVPEPYINAISGFGSGTIQVYGNRIYITMSSGAGSLKSTVDPILNVLRAGGVISGPVSVKFEEWAEPIGSGLPDWMIGSGIGGGIGGLLAMGIIGLVVYKILVR